MTGILGRPPPRFEGEIGSRPSRVPSLRDPAAQAVSVADALGWGEFVAWICVFGIGCTYVAYNALLDND